MKYILLYSSILFNVLTNVGFKLSSLNEDNPTKKWGFFLGGLVFGLINSILFTECLKYISLQIASAIFFSLTIIGLFLFSHFYFGETMSLKGMIGSSFIIIGVILVSMNG
jgi:multidrug transporter EmrE-like cation transporter